MAKMLPASSLKICKIIETRVCVMPLPSFIVLGREKELALDKLMFSERHL